MSGNITNLTPEEVEKTGQPVLLFNSTYNEWAFVSNDKNGPDNAVQSHPYRDEKRNLFVLESVGNDRYRIYNRFYKQWVFVSNDRDRRDHVVLAHPYRNETRNEFVFQAKKDNSYQIYNPSYSEYLFVVERKRRGDQQIFSHPYLEERNYFNLQLMNDAEVIKVDFQVDRAKIGYQKPVVLATNNINNTSGVAQTTAFTMQEGVSEKFSFVNTIGVQLKVGTAFSTGIPFVSEGKVSVSTSTSYSYSCGKETTVSRNYSATFNLVCPPGNSTTGKAIVQKANIDVPYKMTLRTREGNMFYSHGVWKGVSHWNLQYDVTSSPNGEISSDRTSCILL